MISMTDLHTHILPGIDDGAPDMDTALQMLEIQVKQGVNTVALTPHYYRNREHLSDFLLRRENAWSNLQSKLKNIKHPKLILSAEVAYVPGMADWDELEQLCYAETKVLLVEPPMNPWNDEMFHQLYAIEGRRGITPMIAHFDRYIKIQSKQRIDQLMEMGLPIQVGTESLLRFFGRKRAMKLITECNAIPVSDCHNIDSRPPNLDAAARVMRKILGNKTDNIFQYADKFCQWAYASN